MLTCQPSGTPDRGVIGPAMHDGVALRSGSGAKLGQASQGRHASFAASKIRQLGLIFRRLGQSAFALYSTSPSMGSPARWILCRV
jgi:hypothetical protein